MRHCHVYPRGIAREFCRRPLCFAAAVLATAASVYTLRMPEIEEIEDDPVLDAIEERKAAMAGPSTHVSRPTAAC